MGYRDTKNPWHIVFDTFKEEYPELSSNIKVFHPVEYPVIEIEYTTGEHILYHGNSKKISRIDPNVKNDFYKQLWYLLTT